MPLLGTRSGAGAESAEDSGEVPSTLSDTLAEKLTLMSSQIEDMRKKVSNFDETFTKSLETLKVTVTDSVQR
jgi:hypothetical protein